MDDGQVFNEMALGSFEAETGRWPSGWKLRAQTSELCAWENAQGGSCRAGAERASPVCDAGDGRAAAAEEDDGAVGIIWCGAVVGEERSPLGRGPSEPPDSKVGHKHRQPVSSWSISRKNRTHNRLPYGHTGRLTPS